MFRAVGVRHKQRPLAVVAAAGAHRFAFLLPRLARASLAPCSGVLFSLVFWRSCFVSSLAYFDALFTRCRAVVGLWGANRAPPQLAVCCALPHEVRQVSFFARVMDANGYCESLLLWVCVILAALWRTRLALPPVHQAVLSSPREAFRNDSLGILRTRFIVTGRLPPVRAETRATAGRPPPRQAFSGAHLPPQLTPARSRPSTA